MKVISTVMDLRELDPLPADFSVRFSLALPEIPTGRTNHRDFDHLMADGKKVSE
jgi:hypothetical protein